MTGTDARRTIFAALTRQLAGRGNDDERKAAVRDRLARHPRGIIPARSKGDGAHRLALFIKMAQEVNSTVARVDDPDDVPKAVADYLRAHNLAPKIRHGDDARLAGLDWQAAAPALEVTTGPASPDDETSLTHAAAGVAETGTLVLPSGPDNPVTLNFLPENHIVVLAAGDIKGSYEDVWDMLRAAPGSQTMARTVNLVTGPSRTGDIEQKIELGAHGPRRLHIIITGRPGQK